MEKLRLLAACSECGNQFDASERAVGSQFHCTCGHLVTVPAPQAHEAAVVRCSSCGAPREGKARHCTFCGGDFTLHEKDLNTICPKCFARTSSRGRFCHHCATPIVVQGPAGSPTAYACPVCGEGQTLASRRVGGQAFAALECGQCGGLFIGNEAFRILAEDARKAQLTHQEHGQRKPSYARPVPPPQQGSFYRSCPQCDQRMNRQNYGRSSGIIIDLCREHGVWFDSEELDQILAWIRHGGLSAETERRAEQLAEAEREQRFKSKTATVVMPDYERRPSGVDVLARLVDFATDLFLA